jgi:hypothetical protein
MIPDHVIRDYVEDYNYHQRYTSEAVQTIHETRLLVKYAQTSGIIDYQDP